MAINYRKCPQCGFSNTIRIVYGYPSSEMFELQNEGKVMLGGCCLSEHSPQYHCKDCGNQWNREDSIEHEYNKIRGIRAHSGGYWGGYYDVEIDFKSRRLKWSHKGSGHNEEYEKVIRQSSLDKLKEGLKFVHILNWRSKYLDLDVCDGTQWGVELLRDGRTIKKYGDNMFPDEWEEFCRLIERISGNSFG